MSPSFNNIHSTKLSCGWHYLQKCHRPQYSLLNHISLQLFITHSFTRFTLTSQLSHLPQSYLLKRWYFIFFSIKIPRGKEYTYLSQVHWVLVGQAADLLRSMISKIYKKIVNFTLTDKKNLIKCEKISYMMPIYLRQEWGNHVKLEASDPTRYYIITCCLKFIKPMPCYFLQAEKKIVHSEHRKFYYFSLSTATSDS